MADMSPAEELFFATGELPPELVEEPKEEVVEEPAVVVEEPVVVEEVVVDPQVAAIERLLAQNEALTAKFEALAAQVSAKPAPPPEEVPDENLDPLGAILHKLNSVNGQVAALETKLSTEQQNNLMRQQFEAFTGSVNTAKAAFEATTPDFKEAYAHIRNLRTEDLRAAGASDAEIPKILLQDELQLAQTAIARGKNPAAEMYAMAKRYGYAPSKTTPLPTAVMTPEQKMAALQVGKAAARLPTKATGTDEPLTIDGLKDAGNEELNGLIQDDKAWARIVGGRSGNDIF